MNHKRGDRGAPKIRDLTWSRRTLSHARKHGVSQAEVDEAWHSEEPRFIRRGKPITSRPNAIVFEYYACTEAGRYLVTILEYIGDGLAIVVTARDMTSGERRKFLARF